MENLTVETVEKAVIELAPIELAQNLIRELDAKLSTHQTRRDEIAADVQAATATANETRENYLAGSTGERKLTEATQRADTLKSALQSIQARVDAVAAELSQARQTLEIEQLLADAGVLAEYGATLQAQQTATVKSATEKMEQAARDSLRILKDQYETRDAFNLLARGRQNEILRTLKERGFEGEGIFSLSFRDDERPIAFHGFQRLREMIQLNENLLENQV